MPVATRPPRRKISPVTLAREWGICPTKVIGWIRSGQLRAINVARDPNGKKPRFLIDRADIAEFEDRRAVTPPEPPAPRRRRTVANSLLNGPDFV